MHRNNKIGKGSQRKLNTANPIKQQLVAKAFEISNKRKLHCPDFSITDALRTSSEQFNLYKVGRVFIGQQWARTGKPILTKCDGYDILSTHQSGMAIDYAAWVDGKSNFDDGNMALIATVFYEAAFELGIEIEWGGNYGSISDGCHIEIVKYIKR